MQIFSTDIQKPNSILSGYQNLQFHQLLLWCKHLISLDEELRDETIHLLLWNENIVELSKINPRFNSVNYNEPTMKIFQILYQEPVMVILFPVSHSSV